MKFVIKKETKMRKPERYIVDDSKEFVVTVIDTERGNKVTSKWIAYSEEEKEAHVKLAKFKCWTLNGD